MEALQSTVLTRRALLAGAGAATLASTPPAQALLPSAPRVALVTGGNSGVGFRVAEGLARSGYAVLLACRSEEKGIQAKRE